MPGPDELRRCRALHGQTLVQCEGQVTEMTTHIGDHWVMDGTVKRQWAHSIAARCVCPSGEHVVPGSDCPARLEQARSARLSQVGGRHYAKFKIQPWDVIDEYGLGFYAGNALKYLLRAGHKGSKVEDLKKCRHYLDKLIELEEARNGG